MTGYCKTILVGNLTKDPELRYTPQGTAVAGFNVAVNTSYVSAGEKKEDVLFMEITVFGKRGESCSKYLSKGSPVLVEGKLQERKWEHEGKKYSKISVIANEVKFLGKKGEVSKTGEEPESDTEQAF